MAKTYPYLLVLLSLVLGSYYYEEDPEPESSYTPVLMTREQLEKSVRSSNARPMVNPGKIYLKEHLFMVVEKYEGVHIIDNSDRANPIKIGFIHIPGCIDIAMKENILYADNATDLIAINTENFPVIQVVNRTKNVFPELVAPDLEYIPHQYSEFNRPQGTIIVAWIEK